MTTNGGNVPGHRKKAEDLIRDREAQRVASRLPTPPAQPSGPDNWIALAASSSDTANAGNKAVAKALRDAMVPINTLLDRHHMTERYSQNHELICAPLFEVAHDRNYRMGVDVKNELAKLQEFLDKHPDFSQQTASLKSVVEKADQGFWNWLAERTRGKENTFGRI